MSSVLRPATSLPPVPSDASVVSVLFVDDDPTVLRAIRRSLVGSPLQVLTVTDPEEALTILGRRRIDVLVSDIDMPGMDGLTLVSLVRARFPTTLRMILSGQSTLDRALQAINEGEVLRFFPKPFVPDAFRRALESLTDRIAQLRLDGEDLSRAARRAEFQRWMEASYPGVTSVARTEDGAIALDVDRLVEGLVAELEASSGAELVRHLRGDTRSGRP